VAHVEGFLPLRASEPGGQTGLTGVRTFVGVEPEFGRVELTVGYLRQHTIRKNGADCIGHAPFLGLSLAL
jgi:hypothetical protein